MRSIRSRCTAIPISLGTSRVDKLAVDTSLGIQGAPCFDDRKKCDRCRRRRCRCE